MDIEKWIKDNFFGYGVAVRRQEDPPIPGEPFMSIADAKELVRKIAREMSEPLCRSLAFHVVETELTLQFTDGDAPETHAECAAARKLIAEAGFDFDTLYPVENRPTAVELIPHPCPAGDIQ